MPEINYLAVAVTTVAAFILSSIWYTVFGKARMALLAGDQSATAELRKMPAWKILAELVRSFVVAYTLARFVVLLGVHDWIEAVKLGAWVWFGFPFAILAGAVLWDRVSWRLTAIHAGDWLVKLIVMAVILGAWS